MIKLTSPDGGVLYLRGDDIFAVHAPITGESMASAKSVVTSSSGLSFYVREAPIDVVKKLGG